MAETHEDSIQNLCLLSIPFEELRLLLVHSPTPPLPPPIPSSVHPSNPLSLTQFVPPSFTLGRLRASLSVCLLVYLFAFLAAFLYALPDCLSSSLTPRLPSCLPALLPLCMPTFLPHCLPSFTSACQLAYLPICLPALLLISLL